MKFLPQLSKLLYQLVHSMLLRDGKYSYQEPSYVLSGTECLPFALSTLEEGGGGVGGGVRRDWPCLKSSLVKGRVRKVWIKGGQFNDAARVAGTLVIFVNL